MPPQPQIVQTPQPAAKQKEMTYGDYQRVVGDPKLVNSRVSDRVIANYYSNTDPNVSVRPPYTRMDYEYFRPNEIVPATNTQEEYRRIMFMCNSAYKRIGIVRSVVDLMAEFTVKGIEIVHPDEGPNNFYKAWSQKINLEERCERFCSWLYKVGNVVVRRAFGQIEPAQVNQMKRQNVKAYKEFEDKYNNHKPGRLPLKYLFYDPSTVYLVGGFMGTFSDVRRYGLRIPVKHITGIYPRTPMEQEVFDALPPEVKNAIYGKVPEDQIILIPIPADRVYVGHYKKDDSEMWATSFIYSILSDIFYHDKLKLAKSAGLDGFYNSLRIWKLGDHTSARPRFPSPDQFSKLAGILQQQAGGGSADIIWGSDISLQTEYPPIDKLQNFPENYENILMGLGISTVLVGGTGEGNSNNGIIGLKNLITRLAEGRRVLEDWLNKEIDIIQENMGFRQRPYVRFTYEDIHDERVYYNMLIQLLDRNVISDKTVLERINELPDIEALRVNDEHGQRKSGDKPDKTSPYHKPDLKMQQQHEMKKIKLDQFQNTEVKHPPGSNDQGITNRPKDKLNGRPPGSRDKLPRQRGPKKSNMPKARLLLSAGEIYDNVNRFVTDQLLQSVGVKDVRSLSAEQRAMLDKAKMFLYPRIEPGEEITLEVIEACAKEMDSPHNEAFNRVYNSILSQVSTEKLTEDEKRTLRVNAYASIWSR